MTGVEFKNLVLTQWGEVGSGLTDNTRMNSYCLTASYNLLDKKIEEFQSTQKVTREIRQLIIKTGVLTPINATIDVSPTSSVVDQYYSFVDLLVTSPYNGSSLSNYAKERAYDQFQSGFTEGRARYPRYYFSGDVLTIEPSNATSCVLRYFKTPFTIDVTDNTNPIPYNGKYLQLLAQEVINVGSQPNRDQQMNQSTLQSEAKNP